ncbi:LacI family DNA-binding transcriptional regulator [Pacificibacter marinus]|uniref:LacI family DNA-binding transcriptional regulator n=1 Tax=Pacificibacter marinus TaxID=658057 RepID=UPI001C071F2C|nr:LacI family DNA-binding transcriptional regulator [Pacificibacter marinus]MBU2867396.1 LacI family transcriptional regulator [Pacificibacter marinus]
MSTVKDVAQRAGVSVGTVSKVLSRNPTVKPALRERVMHAVDELGYKPNLAARALRTNKVNVIGLVVPDISNPYFAQLVKCVEAEASKQGHMVMMVNTDDDPAIEITQINALLAQSPHGLIVIGSTERDMEPIKTEVPIVSLDRRFLNYKLISADHVGGSAQVAEHLFHLGHRRIAYISGQLSTEVGRLRKQGFCDRLTALAGRTASLELTSIEGQFDYTSGDEIARRLLSVDADKRPTAIATASDQQAIGVLRAARDLNIDVPQQLSIVGFDDIILAELVVPRLTSVSQNTVEMARLAVHCLLSEAALSPQDHVIDTVLKERGSTAAPCQA